MSIATTLPRHRLLTFRRVAGLVLAVGIGLLVATTAYANEVRYVAFGGDDANPCTRLAPCLTLQRGIDATPDGGEIQFLTAGEHTPVTITRSITISAEGVPIAVQGVVVNGADAVVTLRGLLLNGAGSTSYVGVKVRAAQAVHIVRCEIERFRYFGIHHETDNAKLLFVSDSIVHDNRIGLRVTLGAGPVFLENSRFVQNHEEGIQVFSTDITITDSLASANSGDRQSGILVANGARAHITATTSTSNGYGFRIFRGVATLDSSTAGHNSRAGVYASYLREAVRISNSTLTGNAEGLNNQATALTRRNNTISGNGTDLIGNPLIPLPAQ